MAAPAPEPATARAPAAVAFERRILLTGLLLILVALKFGFNPGLGRNSLDGDFYFQIARHVAEGDGLVTSVSLYHQGLQSFPHPTNASPLWPLALGYAGRLLDLAVAAALVPELLYVVDLLLLYLLAVRLADSRAGGGRGLLAPGGTLDCGHAAVLLFGLNPIFFEFTSLPYTEALAFALVLAALLATGRAATRGSVALAAAAGLAAGLAALTRVQMAGLLVAVPAALAAPALGAVLRGRRGAERGTAGTRRALALAGTSAAAASVPLAAWALWLATWMRPLGWRAMVAIGAYRETPELAPFSARPPAAGSWLAQPLEGLRVAFSAFDPDAYVASHGLAAWLVPLAALAGLVAWLGRRRLPVPSPAGTLALATVLAGLAMLAPLHRHPMTFFKDWLFGFRHGLPLILLVVWSLIVLARHRQRVVRALVLVLVGASILAGARGVARAFERDAGRGPGLVGAEPELVAWLDAHRPRPAVVTTNAQPLAVYSRSFFHWMDCDQPETATLALLEHAGADYVLAYPTQQHCNFLGGLEDRLEVAARFGSHRLPVTVLRLAGGGPASPPPAPPATAPPADPVRPGPR